MGPSRYAPAARAMHWLTAAIVAVVIVVGVWIHYFEPADEPFKLRLYNVHESLGVVVFALGAVANENAYNDCYDSYYCEDNTSDGEAAMWIGGLIVVGSTLYDLYDAGRAVTRYTDRKRKAASYQFSPTMMSKAGGGMTPGVGVTGSF